MSAPSQSGTAWIDGTNASATLGAERGLDEEQQKTESNASSGVFNLCNTRVEILGLSRRNRIQRRQDYRAAALNRGSRFVPATPRIGADLPISTNCRGSDDCRLRALFADLPVLRSSRSFSVGVPRKVYGFFSGGLCLGYMGRCRNRLGCHCALRIPHGSVGS